MTSQEAVRLSQVRRLAATGRAKEIRLAADLTQSEVAAAIQVPQPVLSRWESGDRRPKGQRALRYLKLLETLEGVGPG